MSDNNPRFWVDDNTPTLHWNDQTHEALQAEAADRGMGVAEFIEAAIDTAICARGTN